MEGNEPTKSSMNNKEKVESPLPLSIPAEHRHCLNCFHLDCQVDVPCSLVNCLHCGIRLHGCKLEDHIENICSRAPSQCPNAVYGCPVRLRRHFLAAHLTHCPASLVHCPHIRTRQFHSDQAKRALKRMAKGWEPALLVGGDGEMSEESLVPDVAFARIDQEILERFFRTPREWRRRLRPSAIPQSGLPESSRRYNQNDAGNEEEEVEDSSDEEQRALECRQKAIREPFAGCRLCRLNPGSQHLHELGSMRGQSTTTIDSSADGKKKRKNQAAAADHQRQSPLAFLPDFYRQRGLLICPDVSFMGIVADEQYLRVNYPIFGCSARFVRRDQFQAHYQAHLTLEEEAPASVQGRCPNWQRGCPFRVDTRVARQGGVIRFNPFLSACVHEPVPQLPVQCRWPAPAGDRLNLGQMPAALFRLLAVWLDDASLRTLAACCQRLRQMLTQQQLCAHRMCLEMLWRRDNSSSNGRARFVPNGVRRMFAPMQGAPPPLIVQPQGALIDHLQQCPHGSVHELGPEPVDLNKIHGWKMQRNPTTGSLLFSVESDFLKMIKSKLPR